MSLKKKRKEEEVTPRVKFYPVLGMWCTLNGYIFLIFIHTATPDALSSLATACWGGHLEVCKVLLQAGANVNLTTANGITALHCAAEK